MADTLKSLHHYKNILFDLDGTLIDSNDQHAHSFMEAFEQHGITGIEYHGIRNMIGMNGESILSHVLAPEIFEAQCEQILTDRETIFAERYMDSVKPLPGVLPLFQQLKEMGYKLVLCTASPPRFVDPYVEQLGIADLIEGATHSEDVPEGKPSPAAIEACCERFGFAPTETIMVGDSPYDIISATEFMVAPIGLLTGGYSREDLIKTGAMAVYENLEDMRAHFSEVVLSQQS